MTMITAEVPHDIKTMGGDSGQKPPLEVMYADGGEDDNWVQIGLKAMQGYLLDPQYAAKVDRGELTGHDLLDAGHLALVASEVRLDTAA